MDAFVIRDTHKLIAHLQKRGFSAQQAEGITEAIKEVDASSLATKDDINQTTTIIKWTTGMLLAQAALVVTLIEYLK